MNTRLPIVIVIIVCCAVAILSAAPGTVEVTFHSDPDGATLYEAFTGRRLGYGPVTAKFETSKLFRDNKRCDDMAGVVARWASGAEASLDTVAICPNRGAKQEFTVVRPVNAPDRDIDVQFALELARIRALKAAAAPKRETTCYSLPIGKDSTYTQCESQ